MAETLRNPPQLPSNGVITAPNKGVVGTNRKKAKRRAKQAAKAAQVETPIEPVGQEVDYNEDPLVYEEDEDYEYSDAEQPAYREHYSPPPHHHHHGAVNGYDLSGPAIAKKNRRRKKKNGAHTDHYDLEPRPQLPEIPRAPSLAVQQRGPQHQNIWNTSTQQERQNIKNFWLSLSEEERKSLLKIEKEAVLRKMKQQQKHSCSCTVCGRKRTAIEEELEVLYEGYYEELEQYAHHDNPPLPGRAGMPPPLGRHPLAAPPPPPPPPPPHSHHRSSQIMEHLDEEDEYSEGDEEYSDEEYSDEEPEPARPPIADFFNFGQNLTVKDNLLTVADDLLKNDGRKFIEMMEQLAERRMQRESEAEYAAANPSHPNDGYHPHDGYNGDVDPGDEYEDDEGSYDSQEYDEDELDEDDEMSGLTEEQRMQEGRRMFQIFAARMFEHRVLTAYKEKVAAERQQKLLEELEDEETLQAQREAKKKRDAEKKKDKKRQQQAAKAEEKAKKEAEKAAEEARIREAEEQRQEEQRRRKEEQRKKKDDEKRKLEEDRLKKEADRLRRQQEEQQRREDAERKLREQKSAEKAKKEEARKREKEDREAREKLARDRKVQEELEKRERELKIKPEEKTHEAMVPVVGKRPSHQNMIAIPGVLTKQPPAVASPNPAVAMATKAPTPAKRSSQQGSHASSPRQAQSQISSKTSPISATSSQQAPPGFPKTILQKPQAPPQSQLQGMPMLPQQMQPPPGMSHPGLTNGFSHLPPQGYPPNMMANGMRSPHPMYPHTGPPLQMQGRMSSFGAPGMNGMPPPGMMPRTGYSFDSSNVSSPNAPPGFGIHLPQQASNHASPIGPPDNRTTPLVPHSRQQSVNDKFDAAPGHSMGRPAPIQPPSSVKPHDDNGDIDDLSKHLGSSALLDDDEEDQRPLGRRISQRGPLDSLGGFGSTVGSFGAPGSVWPTASPFSQSPGLGHQWGNMPSAGVPGWNSNSFASNAGFGSISGAAAMHRPSLHNNNRPLTIRIAVCHACKQLSSVSSSADGYHEIDILLRQIEHNRPPLDSPPTLKEIEDICETEGDAQNGGGELQVRKALTSGAIVAVRWQPDAITPDLSRQAGHGSLGEIGSPLPAKSTPAIGFGAPGMGRSSVSGWAH